MTNFVKMHGLGNDFVVIDGMREDPKIDLADVPGICDRHFGVGADGVIIVRPAENADGFMDYVNSDGSLAQMCGNGVRVVAKFLVDNGYVDSGATRLTVDTRAALRGVEFDADEGMLTQATVAMGEPILDPRLVPVNAPDSARVQVNGREFAGRLELDTPWGQVPVVAVSTGNPHGVVFLDDAQLPDELFASERTLSALDLDKIGAYLESHEAFPENANIEFVTASEDGLTMRVFERGVGETLACGTGACAVLVAAALTGQSERKNDVHLPGGTLRIDWRDDDVVYMTGPATTVFTGTI